MSVRFVAKGEIEVPVPSNVTVMQLGYGDTRRVRFMVEYDADNPQEADGFLRDTIGKTAELLREASVASNQDREPKEGNDGEG